MGRSWLEKCYELERRLKADKELGRDDLIYTLMAQKEDAFFQVEKSMKRPPLEVAFSRRKPRFSPISHA